MLTSFRIRGCFGFSDSGDVDLDPKGRLVYLLGRNSSGKTSFLQALHHLEHGKTPSRHPNFLNFDAGDEDPLLLACFTNPSLDPQSLLNSVKKKLVASRVPQSALDSHPPLVELQSEIEDLYTSLAGVIENNDRVWVEKDKDGHYKFLTDLEDCSLFSKRRTTLTQRLQQIFRQSKLRFEGKEVELQNVLTFPDIEDELFRQFPEIISFSESYSLGDSLPDRITEETLAEPENGVTEALLDYLGQDQLRAYLAADDPDKMKEILATLSGKAEQLCSRINRQSSSSLVGTDLISLILHDKNGLQITVRTDKTKSFYRHISENTKFLFAYHLYTAKAKLTGNILLFDEPNTGFHATAQEFLVEFLESVANHRNQVIIATHSEHMINLNHLSGVRLMDSKEGRLIVRNHPYRRARSKGDFLALQPIVDAIGLRFGTGLTIEGSVVLTEGVTDLLYLRAFNKIYGITPTLNVAPARSDAHILTLVPFFIGQAIGIRIVIDAGGLRSKIQDAYEIPDSYIFEVPVPAIFSPRFRSSGIEDLFSKDDFARLLSDFGMATKGTSFDQVTNSNFMRKRPKRLVAQQLLDSITELGWEFDSVTEANFRQVLAFCNEDDWFRL